MFETITERISKRIRRLSEAISRFRLRWRYYASCVLLIAGYVYCVLGFGLVIPSVLAPPLSLLGLIPALYLVCLGRVFCKYRTQLGKAAIRTMEVSAVILIAVGVFLLSNYVLVEEAKMLIWFEIAMLVILAGPGLFVITHGHSLFGPTAIPHDQLAKLYNKLLVLNIVEPTPHIHCEAKEEDECYPTLVFCGNFVIIFLFAFLSILIAVDGKKRYIPYESAEYCGSENLYPSNGTEDDYGSEAESPVNNNLLVLMCSHVAEGGAKPTCVFQTPPVSEADSGWQCLCSQSQHDPSEARFIGVNEAIQRCPQLKEIIKKSRKN